MRDILVTLIVLASIPYIFKQPIWGGVMWIWISVMNPHAQGWGFARTFPFAALIACVTLAAILMSKERQRFPTMPVSIAMLAFLGWMGLSTLFAIHPDGATEQLIKVTKILGMSFVLLMVTKSRRQIMLVLWAVVFSLGFYGVKGGIFTIRSGGSFRIWGPEGTFIEGNNEIALAIVMVIPLIYFLYTQTENKWWRYAGQAAMCLCALSALASYSRGAALAIGVMGAFLWFKSHNRLTFGLLLGFAVPLMLMIMPGEWFDRINSINDYKEDGSAMGRINAWNMTFNLAKERPLFGGGFDIYDPGVFLLYAPNPLDVHAAHSIYFQVLGEHGFVGLLLFALIGFLTWRNCGWVVRQAKRVEELRWAASLASMIQVSLLGFFVGGAFLSLAYFDVPYYLVVIAAATRRLVSRTLRTRAEEARAAASAPQPFAESALS
ncbi:putative O-glycosylation ligase, exosortase A system-associated [Duganella callida]|nr:putative O-glycosylation ligase, exosortase A system-associated [Duganella callida]